MPSIFALTLVMLMMMVSGVSDVVAAAEPGSPADVPLGTRIVFQLDLRGEIGLDIAPAAVKRALDDARRWNPDVLVVRMDCDFLMYGHGLAEWTPAICPPQGVFFPFQAVREIQTMLTERIQKDAEWRTREGGKPALVAWVDRALGCASLIPFVAPRILYTSRAHHGGAGCYERLSAPSRNVERPFNLPLGRAEGLAISGGHAPELIRAMTRTDYVLSVTLGAGGPRYFPNDPESGEMLLTDDGDAAAGRQDRLEDIVSFKGNDVLILDAQTAQRLRLADAIVDTPDEMLAMVASRGSAMIVRSNQDAIFAAWAREITQAQAEMVDAIKRVRQEPPADASVGALREGFEERARLLARIGDLWGAYEESINPFAIPEVPLSEKLDEEARQLRLRMKQPSAP